jgi:tetratricopeptide (TPR) repeat protein
MPLPRSPRRLLASVFVALALGIGQASADELTEAQALIKQGQLAQAAQRIDAFLAKQPRDARARFLRGIVLTEQKRIPDAIKVFTALTEEFPELPEPYNNLAVIFAAQGQFERARQMLEMAIRTHPSYATAHENLGDIYAKMASEAYDRALQLDRGNVALKAKLELIRELFSSAPRMLLPSARTDGRAPLATAPAPARPAAEPAAAKPTPVSVRTAPEPAAVPATPGPRPAPLAEAAAPAAKPAPEPARPSSAIAETTEILKTVEGWARAWSNNDVDGYLAFYAKGFRTPRGLSRANWERERRERIAKPRRIEVRVIEPEISRLEGNRVRVVFRQDYRSDTLRSQIGKSLTLVRVGERWLIEQESVLRQAAPERR